MRNLIILMLTAVCFISSIGYASERDVGVVSGMVVDDEAHKPVSSATVALLDQKDAKILSSVASGKDGNFELNNVPFGKYRLMVSSDNNESKIIDTVEVSKQTGSVKLGQIILPKKTSFQMEEIKVVSQKLKGEEKIDRTVYTINDDIRNVSTTGLDMLRQVPSVTVDFLNNVMLEGRSDIQFYVDGVKRDKEFVMQLDPQIIDKVELITNPSVKYDPDISGVISIVLKKQGRFGVNGAVTVPVTNPNKGIAQPSANIEYGSDRYRVYAGVFIHYEGFDRRQYLISDWNDNITSSRKFEKISTGRVKWINQYSNYGVDWFVNDKTSLNFLGEWSSWKEKSRGNIIDNRSYENDVLNQYYKTSAHGDMADGNNYFSLFLRRELEQEGCEFNAEIYYNKENGNFQNEYIDIYYNIDDLASTADVINRRESSDNSTRSTQLKLDYSFLIKNIKNEIGIKTLSERAETDAFNGNNLAIPSENDSQRFDYDQWRQTAYYNAQGALKMLKWQVGVTGEYSSIDVNKNAKVHNFFFLPQVSLQRDFDNTSSIKLSYQKRIRRPQMMQLDPFERTMDSLHVRKGDKDLKPEEENKFELNYSKNFKSDFISPKLYLHYSNNAIQDVTATRDDGISETTSKNIGKTMEYGLGLNASVQISGPWRLNGSIAVYNMEVSSGLPYDNDVRQKKSGCRFSATNTIALPKDYSIAVTSQYNGPGISYRREDRRDLLVLLNMGKKFSKNAELNILYVPFIKDFNYSKSIVSYPGYREVNSGSVYVKNLFFIEFKYHFNSGKQIKKIERDVDYEKGQSGGGL